MPENTFIYDTVWEEFREELQLTYDETVSYTHLTLPTSDLV